ncbi:thioredoxin-like protein YtpP [Clostridium saccharobutylicum]|uniref:thioredoxin family protein n=1 Tax=Clostridium saccharobutylicum TaxID=169679 RepID=UPI000983AE19|nr:thioredoxin family protein [Clostridium saccharobutylicum]AQS10387.1 thioredoxin-like protein YtpP [Clostridium saccharobutylicum]MBC2438791.1 thioredoxin family protein [Clostridium saccharobutylicum]NSB91064.1 thiol-disulfide isomerase/thioredoxin [Clostridium saccharobutylicum]NYC31331.1 thiol-disulfide isomerase/thioredoxin [Clostridium saccharobutylicum]OOM19126.1 thioredoxin-like protein YtpP [Clostridium saccharobutylicum]
MNKLHKDSEIEELIKSNSMSVIYFTGSDCGACEVIKIKIEDILKRFHKIKSGEINTQKHLDLAAKYNIFSVPVFILFIEGKESIRVGRNINLLELESNIKRYYDMIF